MNSTWLITSELANQLAPKVLFTCVVYTNNDNCGEELAKSEWMRGLRRHVKMTDKNNQDRQKIPASANTSEMTRGRQKYTNINGANLSSCAASDRTRV